jgi:hypothetical protein
MYGIDDIEKIKDFKTWSNLQKIDKLLQIDCKQYTELGIDSSKKEKDEVRKNSMRIYRIIKTIDREIGDRLISSADNQK